VQRDFTPTHPDELWVGDITYVRTWEGWLYLSTIIDCFSRRVIGWAMADHVRTELPLTALRMALARRNPSGTLIHYTDRGCQYTSEAYNTVLESHGVRSSLSRPGNCWDNAVAESFFSTLKLDPLYRHSGPTRAAARSAILEYLEGFYNRERRHTTLGNLSPADYESAHAAVCSAQQTCPSNRAGPCLAAPASLCRCRGGVRRVLGEHAEPPRESWRLFHARRSDQWPSRAGIPRS
jgi:putative transposase